MYRSCSKEIGSGRTNRKWAIEQCKNNMSCNILHDAWCDNINWRYCVGLDINDFADTSGQSCSLIRAPKGEPFILCTILRIRKCIQ